MLPRICLRESSAPDFPPPTRIAVRAATRREIRVRDRQLSSKLATLDHSFIARRWGILRDGIGKSCAAAQGLPLIGTVLRSLV